jgi:hypothetical protein
LFASLVIFLLVTFAANVDAQINVALDKPIIDGSGSWNGGTIGQGDPFDGGQFPARLAVDGVKAEPANGAVGYWLGREFTDNEYFTIDLGQPFRIDQVNLFNTHNRQFNDRATDIFELTGALEIDADNQLVNPYVLASGFLLDTRGLDDIPPDVFTSGNGLTVGMARYLRFEAVTWFNFGTASGGSGLTEIEVFDSTFVPPPSPNKALGKPVIDGSGSWDGATVGQGAAFDAGMFPATTVTDGSRNDADGRIWLGREGVVNEYFTLDLEENIDIQEILLRNTRNRGSADRGTRDFRILAAQSLDANLELVAPVEILNSRLPNVAGYSPLLETVFTAENGLVPTTARYLRFDTLDAYYFADNVGLNEIEVYEEVMHEPTQIDLRNNLAYGKPVIDGSGSWDGGTVGQGAAFDMGPFPATRVVDGSTADDHIDGGSRSSYWLGRQETPGEYFTLDLEEVFTIEQVELTNTWNAPYQDRRTDDFVLFGATEVDENNQLIDPVTLLEGTLSNVIGQTMITPDVFDSSNGLTVADVRYLQFVAMTSPTNGSGLNEIAVFGRTPGSADLIGDYNGNGTVEQADLDLVLLNWGAAFDTLPPGWVGGRPTSGFVDQEELDNVLLAWGNTLGAASATGIPEPTTLCLLLVVVLCAGWRRLR